MTITVNGQQRTVPDGMTVADIVPEVARTPTGVAVAVNEQVVPRSDWATHVLGDRDRVDILTAVQGG